MSGFSIRQIRRVSRAALAVYFLLYTAGLPWLHICSEEHVAWNSVAGDSSTALSRNEGAGHDDHAGTEDGCPACAARELPGQEPPTTPSRTLSNPLRRRGVGEPDGVVPSGPDLICVLPRAPPSSLLV